MHVGLGLEASLAKLRNKMKPSMVFKLMFFCLQTLEGKDRVHRRAILPLVTEVLKAVTLGTW